MRFFIVIALSGILFCACAKKEEQTAAAAPVMTSKEAVAKEMKQVETALSTELTDENFSKGKNILGIKMKSVKTGATVDFAQFKGKKILIDFWSSWCIPCIEMFPELNKLKSEFEDKGATVKVITVSVDPMPQKVVDIIKEKNAQFEVLQAPESLQNAGILLPYSVAVDENGVVTQTTNGKHNFEELKKLIGIK